MTSFVCDRHIGARLQAAKKDPVCAHYPRTLVPGPRCAVTLRPFRNQPSIDSPMCHGNVSHMKSTTIRELKHDTSTVLAWVAGGESVEVRRHREPVAILSPVRRAARIVRPDFAARLTAIYGKSRAAITGTELISEARGES